MDILSTTILFLVILSVLVLVHEAGHFFAARLFGVHVEEFGIGFPPRATAWKRGTVLYSLNWLPLGGFVKLKGEQGEAARDPDSFGAKSVWQRMVILCAGVGMNVVFAIFLLTIGFSYGMPQVIDDDDVGAAFDARIQIVNVLPGSSAEKAGILPGDTVLSLDGNRFGKIVDLQGYIRSHTALSLTLTVLRGEQTLERTVTPVSPASGSPGRIGVGLAKTAVVSYPLHEAFVRAVKTTGILIVSIFQMLGSAVSNLAFDGFVGPVGIAAYTGTAAKLGFSYVISLLAQLSISLAVINVLPIPALDGGRVLFALVEKVRGRSLRPVLENGVHLVGFLTLIILLLAVTVRDISRLLPS